VAVLCIEHGGKVGHAELEIGEARIILCDEFPDHDALSPQPIGGTPVMIHLYVEDVDAFAARAVGAGLKVLRPVADQFYGDRGGNFADPSGHRWWIATHKVDISREELKNRAAALFGGEAALVGSARPLSKAAQESTWTQRIFAWSTGQDKV
jgi:PhnB protein